MNCFTMPIPISIPYFSLFNLIKIIVIILLVCLNIYLYILENKNNENTNSSANYKMGVWIPTSIKNGLRSFGVGAGFYATYLTIKDKHFPDAKNNDSAVADKLAELNSNAIANAEEKAERSVGIAVLKINEQSLSKSYSNFNKIGENIKALEIEKEKEKVDGMKGDSSSISTDIMIERAKWQADKIDLDRNFENFQKSVVKVVKTDDADDKTSKSIIFGSVWEKFLDLSLEAKIAICLIFSSSIIISSVINLIYILYGDYIINKFNLDERWKSLATLIKYRRKFTRYYIIINIITIISICLIQILFGLNVLQLTLN